MIFSGDRSCAASDIPLPGQGKKAARQDKAITTFNTQQLHDWLLRNVAIAGRDTPAGFPIVPACNRTKALNENTACYREVRHRTQYMITRTCRCSHACEGLPLVLLYWF